jgi:tRNA A-37 threonylcarbamoyl transferase component Bud32
VTTQLPGSGTILGGDFRIERQLGAGGMGAVYVAEQLSTGRRRAVKLMHPSLVSDSKLRERFEQEARVGAKIPSDHVVQVIAAGVDEATGAPFIAMELLDGDDLAAVIAKRELFSPADTHAILEPVCHALAAAHAAGIVHRDLKPENIFLLHTRGTQRSFDVKLLDFGIAKLTADARTMATSAVGTPLWMAPEQTDPRAKIAPTADVWPLGLLAFTMLTGRSYWRVASDPAVSIPALMREILFEPIDPASVRAVELGIDVPLPMGLDAWFAKCIDRDPLRRFPTAKEAWEALAPVLGADVKPPAQLAALAMAQGNATDRARFEAAATMPVAGQAELAATVPAASLSGPEVNAESAAPAAVAVSGHSTGLSVGHTVPTATALPARSKGWTLATIAAVALVGVGSWQFGASRSNQPTLVTQQATSAVSSSSELPMHSPSIVVAQPVDTPSIVATTSAAPAVGLAELLPSVAAAKPASPSARPKPVESAAPVESAKPALPAFDATAAQRSAEMLVPGAKHICSRLPGPRAFPVTITFLPTGRVNKAKAIVTSPSPASNCAEGVMYGARAAQFDPAMGNGMVTVAISLD